MKLSFFRSDLSGCCLRLATVAAMLMTHPVAIPTVAGMEHKHNINILRLPMQTNIFADRENQTNNSLQAGKQPRQAVYLRRDLKG